MANILRGMHAIFSARPVRLAVAVLLTLVVLMDVRAQDKPKPDVLVFTNGDRLTGQMLRAVGSSVVFKSDMLGEQTIPLDKVQEIQSSTQFVGLTKDFKKHSAVGYVKVDGPNVQILTPTEGKVEATVPKKDLGYLIDKPTYDKEMAHKASPWAGWNGAITGGVTLVRATDNSTTATGSLNLIRTIPFTPYLPRRNRTTVDVTESYGKLTSLIIPPPPVTNPPSPTSTIAKTSIFHADAERDEYFSPRFYALAELSFDHNFSQGLQLQQVYGGGAGWTPIQTAKQQLDLKGDVHYEVQQFINTPGSAVQPTLDLVGSTFAEAYRRTLPYKVVFTETGNYLPAWNNLSAYSANVTGALTLPVWKRLAASISMTDNYLNNPAPYYLKNSYQFVTGITYTLH
jgi:hypothetical protein